MKIKGIKLYEEVVLNQNREYKDWLYEISHFEQEKILKYINGKWYLLD